MRRRLLITAFLLGLGGLPQVVWAASCAPNCRLKGGGALRQDCHAEFASTTMRLNYPPYNPARPSLSRSVRCFDGDPGCDLDDQVNHECHFNIDVCLLHEADPLLPACAPSDVTAAVVTNPRHDAELQSLQTALSALVPATVNSCTSGQSLRVPLIGPDRKGHYRAGTKTVALKAVTAAGNDLDRLTLTCVPRGWPTHGYNHANHRATSVETTLTSTNAANLVVKWTLDLSGAGSNGVTSTPTVGDGVVYVTSWNGKVYAVNAATGAIKWTYDTGSGAPAGMGIQSSATLAADGRLLVGDSTGIVHCLRPGPRSAQLLWTASVRGNDPAAAHIWASPVVANGRVFVGRASHNDVPCTQGHLYAFDLDSGVELWNYATVPDKICSNDTSIVCSVDTDCGMGNTCVDAKGGGVTASVATDATGETLYMVPVGCYSFPSNGNADSMFSLNAVTGTPNWIYRPPTQPPEQFAPGPGFHFYHDYGWLNGPLLIDADDGMMGTRPLLVGGGKNGTLYGVDPSNGAPVWTNSLITPPPFAAFGLFNGAIGFANHRLYAALYNGAGTWDDTLNDHLYAFHDLDGSPDWSAQIGLSWGSMAIANGLLFVGTQASTDYYVYDAASGARLKTFTMPDNVSSGASIVDGRVYVGYGVFGGVGGVQALGLP